MASSLVLKVAAVTSTITFNKTDAEVAQILRWMMADKAGTPPTGLTTAQLNQWWLDQAAAELVRYARQEAAKNRLRELKTAGGNLEAQAEADTAI